MSTSVAVRHHMQTRARPSLAEHSSDGNGFDALDALADLVAEPLSMQALLAPTDYAILPAATHKYVRMKSVKALTPAIDVRRRMAPPPPETRHRWWSFAQSAGEGAPGSAPARAGQQRGAE